MKLFLAALATLLLLSCSSNQLSSGPGTQTTNGFSVEIVSVGSATATVRPLSYRIGDPLYTGSETPINAVSIIAESNEVVTISNLIPDTYLLSIENGDTLGAVDTFTITEKGIVDLGSPSLEKVGSLTGTVDSLFLDIYASVFLYIEGLERTVPINSDGSFTIPSLAPWNYNITLVGSTDSSSTEGTREAIIKSSQSTDLGKVESLYTIQFKKVRAFLDDLGLTTLTVEEVTESNDTVITSLNIDNYAITAIPDNFGQLTFLKKLSLDSNSIVLLPETLGNFKKLTNLSLKGNQFTVMPISLGTCKSIVELDFSENKLDRVSEVISQLKELEILTVNDNQILTLPESIIQNSALKTLDCSSNKISDLPAGIVTSFPDLVSINFEYNKLDTNALTTTQIEWITQYSNGDSWISSQK